MSNSVTESPAATGEATVEIPGRHGIEGDDPTRLTNQQARLRQRIDTVRLKRKWLPGGVDNHRGEL